MVKNSVNLAGICLLRSEKCYLFEHWSEKKNRMLKRFSAVQSIGLQHGPIRQDKIDRSVFSRMRQCSRYLSQFNFWGQTLDSWCSYFKTVERIFDPGLKGLRILRIFDLNRQVRMCSELHLRFSKLSQSSANCAQFRFLLNFSLHYPPPRFSTTPRPRVSITTA